MSKNVTPIILIVLAIGIYFTFTRGKVAELKTVQAVNSDYVESLQNMDELIRLRDNINSKREGIPIEYREGLDKIIPSNIDNIRLIIDINGLAARHGFSLRDIDIKTPGGEDIEDTGDPESDVNVPRSYNTSRLSFTVNATYGAFSSFLKDLETSLRIIDVSSISVSQSDKQIGSNIYKYEVGIQTYWLKQL